MNLDELEKLNELKEKGIITQEELEEQKNKILYGQKKKPRSIECVSGTNKGKNIWNNYLSCWEKSFQFLGRATRYEFWGFVFINTLISFVLSLIDISAETGGILNGIFTLIILVPTVAVTVRRLHDVNKSALALLLPFLCLILLTTLLDGSDTLSGFCALCVILYFIYLIYLVCSKSYIHENKYGENTTDNNLDRIGEGLIIGSILLSIFSISFESGYSSTSSIFAFSENNDQLEMLVSNIREAFQEQPSYDGLNNLMAKEYGLVPTNMYSDQTADKITNAFGTETIIHGEGSTFSITYANLSEEQCMSVSTSDWVTSFNGFKGVVINKEISYKKLDDFKQACGVCSENKCFVSLVFF